MRLRCPACALPTTHCLCSTMPRVATATQVILIRHVLEESKASNSGRWAAQALPSCRLIRHGAREGGGVTPADLGDDAALLFPGGEPLPGARPPRQLVVLDATWPQARSMRSRLLARVPLRLVSLPGLAETLRCLRRPPHPGQLPTLVAIAAAIAALEGAAVAAPLFALYDRAVAGLTADLRLPPRLIAPAVDGG